MSVEVVRYTFLVYRIFMNVLIAIPDLLIYENSFNKQLKLEHENKSFSLPLYTQEMRF